MVSQVIILGAGISGLSLAWELGRQGIKVQVLEADSTIGGLAGTLRQDGYCMDIGPHPFDFADRQLELWQKSGD